MFIPHTLSGTEQNVLELNDDTWAIKQFKNNNQFQLDNSTKSPVLKITSQNASAIYYRQVYINLLKTPILNWSWKVNRILNNPNEKQRSGDDFAARVLVVHEKGFINRNSCGFSFVWASQKSKGEQWTSPVANNIVIVVQESGSSAINQWKKESVDLRAAYKKLLNKDVEEVHFVGLMSDTDDLGEPESSIAHFKNIYFSAK